MLTMEPLTGTTIDTFPWRNLEKVSDLICFDGPLLSLFKNSEGDQYLYYWCDADTEVNRWLVLRVSREDLEAYLHRRISLDRIVSAPGDGLLFALDIDHDLKIRQTVLLSPDQLPASYIPEPDSLLDTTHSVPLAESKYRISIDGDWELEDWSVFPHNYGKAYALMYSLFERKSGWAYHAYPWRGGYSTVNFYNALRDEIPEQHRPQVSSLQYSSPGWLELRLSVPVALLVKDSIKAYISHSNAREKYLDTMKELKARDLLGGQENRRLSVDSNVDSIGDSETLSEDDLSTIRSAMADLEKILNISGAVAEQLDAVTSESLVSLKILLSYYRIIVILASYELDGRAIY